MNSIKRPTINLFRRFKWSISLTLMISIVYQKRAMEKMFRPSEILITKHDDPNNRANPAITYQLRILSFPVLLITSISLLRTLINQFHDNNNTRAYFHHLVLGRVRLSERHKILNQHISRDYSNDNIVRFMWSNWLTTMHNTYHGYNIHV